MRGRRVKQAGMFSYVSTEDRIPHDHPLRTIRPVVDEVLAAMGRRLTGLYAREGRPSIPPEQLMAAMMLQALYGVRSERMLMEQMNYNLLFRWLGTINRYRPRSSLGDVAKAHGLGPVNVRELANQLPHTWWARFEESDEGKDPPSPFAELRAAYPSQTYQAIFEDAEAILKLPRHLSMHPVA